MENRQETLDPENWTNYRELGHQIVDDMMDYLQEIDRKPVGQPAPCSVPCANYGAKHAWTEFELNRLLLRKKRNKT